MAELIELLQEVVEVLGVFIATLRQIHSVDLLVLHQDKLDDFTFDLSDEKASHF